MADKFKFPVEITRREKWVFEKYAHTTWGRFAELLAEEETHLDLTVDMEAALLLVSVRRERGQTVTMDNVLDSDWELLPPEEAEETEAADEGESPLVPPPPPEKTTSTNLPTPSSSV